MNSPVTADELFAAIRNMPSTERARFFSMLGANAFQKEDYSHEQVFGDLENDEFTASEAAEYLEVSLPTFRRYVQSKKISKIGGRVFRVKLGCFFNRLLIRTFR